MKSIESFGGIRRAVDLMPPLEPPKPGRSLPGSYYLREDLFEVELAVIHGSHWLFVGHSIEVPNPGDYLTYEIGRDCLFVIRQDDGELRAFHNVCRHRGSRLVGDERGNAKRIVCPYHAWTYGGDGRLLAARQMPASFEKSSYGLFEAAVAEFSGLIFICLAERPRPIAQMASDAQSRLLPYHLEATQIADRADYVVEANWKIIAENFRECYHCGPSHPEYSRIIAGATAADSRKLAEEAEAATRAQRATWVACGLDHPDINFTPERDWLLQRFAFRGSATTQSLDGQPVAPLLGVLKDRRAGVLAFTVRPNLWLEATSDHVVTMRHTPLSPTRTHVRMTWLVNKNAKPGRDFSREEVSAFWRITGEEDWRICAATQAGVASSHYQPGPLAPSETPTAEWLAWYLKTIGLWPAEERAVV